MKSTVVVSQVLLMVAMTAMAQEYRGRIQGAVSDPSKAVVAGATVTSEEQQHRVFRPRGQRMRRDGTCSTWSSREPTPSPSNWPASAGSFRRTCWSRTAATSPWTPHSARRGHRNGNRLRVSPVSVKFNTTTMDLTVDNTMVKNLPIVARNPFTLALLNPAVVSRYTAQKNPFFMWAASSVEVGGSQNTSGDVLVDGMPVMLGPKSSYAPDHGQHHGSHSAAEQRRLRVRAQLRRRIERVDEIGHQRGARNRLLLRPQSEAERGIQPAHPRAEPGAESHLGRHRRQSHGRRTGSSTSSPTSSGSSGIRSSTSAG